MVFGSYICTHAFKKDKSKKKWGKKHLLCNVHSYKPRGLVFLYFPNNLIMNIVHKIATHLHSPQQAKKI